MVGVHIRVRETKSGRRYVVRYRLGGRAYKLVHAGSFSTLREARTRRDTIAGWIAAGLNPAAELTKLVAAPATPRTYREAADAYLASRIDYDTAMNKVAAAHVKRLNAIFGDTDPNAITSGACIEAVAELAAVLKPSSVSRYWTTHRLILDFAGVTPNPARAAAVKLPAVVRDEPQPPTADEVLAILDQTPRARVLPLIVLEQTAMAAGEIHALAWGDVDVAGSRFRLRRSTVKAGIRARARWVQVPDWLMGLIDATCPLEDRTAERRVFPGFTPNIAKHTMARACRLAKIAHYHPHDLRHRRLSLWHGQGIPAKELAARAGHSKASMTLDIYSHVMPLTEVSREQFEAILVRHR